MAGCVVKCVRCNAHAAVATAGQESGNKGIDRWIDMVEGGSAGSPGHGADAVAGAGKTQAVPFYFW